MRGARFACTQTLRTSSSRPTRSLMRIAISRQRQARDRPMFFAKRACVGKDGATGAGSERREERALRDLASAAGGLVALGDDEAALDEFRRIDGDAEREQP